MRGAEPVFDSSVRSVSRALALLTLFDEETPIRTLRDLIDSSELPKTTVLRLIQTLEQFGYLFERPDGRYCLGPALIRLSRAIEQVWRLPAAADATMEGLRDETKETVNLYVLEGRSRVCVAQKQGLQNIRYVVPVGLPLPLWAGASAKVLLADQEQKFVDRVLREGGKDARFRESFVDELNRVRESGVAVSLGEREPAAASVAAPIRAGDRTIAALAISGPITRFTPDRVKELSRTLKQTVEGIRDTFLTADDEGAFSAWPVKNTAR
jgi:DNA-binding IclR family transcriptional regulator